eukprot:2948562-Prymnesium_polylepis.1
MDTRGVFHERSGLRPSDARVRRRRAEEECCSSIESRQCVVRELASDESPTKQHGRRDRELQYVTEDRTNDAIGISGSSAPARGRTLSSNAGCHRRLRRRYDT